MKKGGRFLDFSGLGGGKNVELTGEYIPLRIGNIEFGLVLGWALNTISCGSYLTLVTSQTWSLLRQVTLFLSPIP